MFSQPSSAEFPPGWVLVNTPKKLWWLRDVLRNVREIAADVETTKPTAAKFEGVPSPNTKVCGISFSWAPGQAAYVPMYLNEEGDTFWKQKSVFDKVVELIAAPLENPDVDKLFQNGKFDIKELYKSFGIKVRGFAFDTMLAHYLLDEEGKFSGVRNHGLKDMAEHYITPDAKKFEKLLDEALDYYDPHYRRYSMVPVDIIYPYGCADSDWCLQLTRIFEPELRKQNLLSWSDAVEMGLGEWGLFPDLLIPVSVVAAQMEMKGLMIDMAKVDELDAFYTKKKEEIAEKVFVLAGRKFDIDSPQVLGEVLFDEMKLPGGRKNKLGWSTDKHVLEKLAEDGHTIAKHLQEYRSSFKLKGSYVDSYRRLTESGKYRLHPNYWINGTVTGRWSASEPNTMQLPRPENGGDLIKAMYIADPGYKLVLCDFSQIELRMAAHCSKDPAWIEAFEAGYDFHAATAHRAFKLDCSVDEVKKLHPDKRRGAKSVNFGILFGMTLWGLANELGWPQADAQKFLDDYFAGCPDLKAWIDETHELIVSKGYVVNPFGRRRRLPEAMMWVPAKFRPSGSPRCFASKKMLNFYKDFQIDVAQEQDREWSNSDVRVIFGGHLSQECVGCPVLGMCAFQNEQSRREYVVEERKRQGLNAIVQGGAVDLTNTCLVRIQRQIYANEWNAYPVLQIHDELGVLVRDDHVEQTMRMMKDVMENTVKLRVPLKADPQAVQRWSDKKE